MLDAKAQTIQTDLDEAARIREEAERLLAELRAERAKAEADAKAMLEQAQVQAKAFEADAKAKLEESLQRRQAMTERKIAEAERRAMDDVRAAATDLAAQMAEQVLASRVAGAQDRPAHRPRDRPTGDEAPVASTGDLKKTKPRIAPGLFLWG
ncbi:hypothetical protein [Phenylobacterium sp. J367]|uniref:F0F1 ATP synthase subunit B family protein n=1 Tax=Phenylobacterium sp. J367 TaxID=2898435 RepID=UPI0027E2BEDD|nr:hypothetical protein [Phenylobacterium sp. J367]